MSERDQGERIQAFDMELADRGLQDINEFGVWLAEQPTKTIWFQNILICLLNALQREYRSLRVGFEKSTPLLAWACRNMLELNIYTKYTLLKGSNAKDFADDRWIDAIEMFSSFRTWINFYDPGGATPGLDQAITNFSEEKAKRGITRAKYMRMETMAAAVNFSEDYKHINKVASKLVHPTAFSVLGSFDEGELGQLKPILLNNGVRFMVEAVADIRRYVKTNGVEPLP
jgi:hypothetical protein